MSSATEGLPGDIWEGWKDVGQMGVCDQDS